MSQLLTTSIVPEFVNETEINGLGLDLLKRIGEGEHNRRLIFA